MNRNEKKSFVLYTNYLENIELLNMEQRGSLFTAILNYENGIPLPAMDSAVSIAFSFIKSSLDRDGEKYRTIVEKRKLAGSIGGTMKERNRVANATFAKQPVANVADNENDTVNDTVNVTETDTDNDNESENVCNTGRTYADGPVSDNNTKTKNKPDISSDESTIYANLCAERSSPAVYHIPQEEKKALSIARRGVCRTDYDALVRQELLESLNSMDSESCTDHLQEQAADLPSSPPVTDIANPA